MTSKTDAATDAAARQACDIHLTLFYALMGGSHLRFLKLHGFHKEAMDSAGSQQNTELLINTLTRFEQLMHGGATLQAALTQLIREGYASRLCQLVPPGPATAPPTTLH